MLAKKYLLRDKKVFSALKFKGKKIRTGPFLMSYFMQFKQKENNRFGFLVLAKNIAKATDRNKIKRKLKAICFPFRNKKINSSFWDLTLVTFNKAKKEDFENLKKELNNFFNEKD